MPESLQGTDKNDVVHTRMKNCMSFYEQQTKLTRHIVNA